MNAVQFKGMIAEYERAQILERSRRGIRHRARQGEVSVLSGAPSGYRFIRKTDHSAAYYEIDEGQARIVREIFELYSIQGLSIGAIARLMNEQAVPTCKRRGRWERSTVWGMLRNPAYKGEACNDGAAPAHHAADPDARWRSHSQQRQSRTSARGWDHDCGAVNRQRGDRRTRPGASPG
jgi:hypothetical protein